MGGTFASYSRRRQSNSYASSVFAMLSLDTVSPQPLEYNTTLMRQVATTQAVERALEHLRPELRTVGYYNTTTAVRHWGANRKCTTRMGTSEETVIAMGTQIPMLYSAQLCYSLVRTYELQRGQDSFDYVVRLRPDHLFVQPLEVGLNLSCAAA